jgi:hypothetical protein
VAKPGSKFFEEWRDTWFGIFILMIIAAALGALLSRLWPQPEGIALAPSTEIVDRMQSLEERILQVANQPTAPGQVSVAMSKRVQDLEERVKTVETVLGASPAAIARITAATAPPQPGNGHAPAPPPETPSGSSPQEFASRMDAAAKSLAAIEQRLLLVETAAKPGAPGQAVTNDQTLKPLREGLDQAAQSIAALTAKLDEVQAKLAAAPDPSALVAAVKTDLDGVTSRVTKIEETDIQGSARRAALGAAVASLTRAAQGPSPFKRELDVVAGLSPGEPLLNELSVWAVRGVPSQQALTSGFAGHAERALKAERDANAGEGAGRFWSNMSSIVSIRTTGDLKGGGTPATLARAEARLKAGDLRAAAAEVASLKGPALVSMAGWLAEAQGRMKVETALTNLNAIVVQSLTQNNAL